MILFDTGPLIGLFDPADASHRHCVGVLESIEEPIATTLPVLTEAFHLLTPASPGAQRLMDFVGESGLLIAHLDDEAIVRAFELMLRYADFSMDLADATLVCAAEREKIHRIFTLDRAEFSAYRLRRGHRYLSFELIG